MGARAPKVKLLVVDDDDSVRNVMVTGLQEAGYAVTGASGGEEALSLLRRRSFDLMVLDLRMPAVDGYEVLRRLREMRGRAETPVFVVTAVGHEPESIIREVDAGVVGRLTKPFALAELEHAIDSALTESEPERESRRQRQARAARVYRSIVDLRASERPEERPAPRRSRVARLLRSR